MATLCQRELAAAAGGTGSTTRMVTNLTRSPEPGRALSVAIGDAAETLASTARASGKQYEARVPTAMITVMEQRGLVQRSTTSMYGVVGTELRFAPSATQYVVRFFKPVP